MERRRIRTPLRLLQKIQAGVEDARERFDRELERTVQKRRQAAETPLPALAEVGSLAKLPGFRDAVDTTRTVPSERDLFTDDQFVASTLTIVPRLREPMLATLENDLRKLEVTNAVDRTIDWVMDVWWNRSGTEECLHQDMS